MKSERYHVERSELVVNETRFDSSSKLAKLLWKNRGQMSRLTTIEIVKIRREVGGRNGVGGGRRRRRRVHWWTPYHVHAIRVTISRRAIRKRWLDRAVLFEPRRNQFSQSGSLDKSSSPLRPICAPTDRALHPPFFTWSASRICLWKRRRNFIQSSCW